MKIQLITPTPPSRKGNWVTAQRWAKILRHLGHGTTIRQAYDGGDHDLLIALHARKSFAAIEAFHHRYPERPLWVTLTGTDIYGDLRGWPEEGTRDQQTIAKRRGQIDRALLWAHRLILLQPRAKETLPPEMLSKARVILQSAMAPTPGIAKLRRWFQVCVVGHLRPVKDPFRTAMAARRLPVESRLRVVHAGEALSDDMARQAQQEMEINPRYLWWGNRPAWQVRRLMAQSHLMVLSSYMEGGSSALSEALVAHLPVLSTSIEGVIGVLGEDHPGYFPVADTAALAELLWRCEINVAFLELLRQRSRALAPAFHLDREIDAWRHLLAEASAR